MDKDATDPLGTEVGLGPGDIVLDGDPAPPPRTERGQQHPPSFRPMSIVAKRSPISATAELLLARHSSLTVLIRVFYRPMPTSEAVCYGRRM